jgi:glycerol-3-phosphate O-acyltransferase
VARILATLEAYGVVESYAEGRVPVHRIAAEGYLAAAYYRNSIIHFFLTAAIAELALLAAADAPPGERFDAFRQHAYALRDVLKFEFFFREKQDFRQAVEVELEGLAPSWRQHLEEGHAGVAIFLATVPLLSADMALRSFIEAYWVVADVLARWPGGEPVEEHRLMQQCLTAGRQYLLQKRLRSPESVSRHLFVTGIQLARHRALLGDGEDVPARRASLAAELEGWLGRMGVVRRIAVKRIEQMVAAETP